MSESLTVEIETLTMEIETSIIQYFLVHLQNCLDIVRVCDAMLNKSHGGEAGIDGGIDIDGACGGGEPNDATAAGALVPSNNGLPAAGVGVLR